jgi:hypothetical protein
MLNVWQEEEEDNDDDDDDDDDDDERPSISNLVEVRTAAAALAHSKAISVLPVPLLYMIEPRIPFEIHVSTA